MLGHAGFFDVRLMGFFRHVPVRAVHELMPYAIGGFLLNLLTGVIFFVGHPEQYAHNTAWWFKVGCLALAGANALVFERLVSARHAPSWARPGHAARRQGHRRHLARRLAGRALLGPDVAVHRRCLLTAAPLGPSALAVAGCAGAPAAQYRPAATVREVMESIVDPAADSIWGAVEIVATLEGTVEKQPRTDDEWQALRRHAVMLMEAGNLLLIPGRKVARPGEKAGDPRVDLHPGRD